MTLSVLPAVQEVLDGLANAWNAGDASTYGALFTSNASYVSFEGDRLDGREAIEAVHRVLFDGPLRGSQMVVEGDEGVTIHSSRLLCDDVAVVVTGGGIQLAGQPELGNRQSVQTVVLVRENEQWRVAAFQNTRQGAG